MPKRGVLRVKYNEILKIKCNEKPGFAGLSALFTPFREILTIKYNATGGGERIYDAQDWLEELSDSIDTTRVSQKT